MGEQLDSDDIYIFRRIQMRIIRYKEITEQEEMHLIIRKCSKINDVENFNTCKYLNYIFIGLQTGQKKANQIFKTFDYKTLYMTKQLETCLRHKDEDNCVKEALDALDMYIAESQKALSKL